MKGVGRGHHRRRPLLREHVLDLLFGQPDLVHRLSSVFQGGVLAIDVGRKEDLCGCPVSKAKNTGSSGLSARRTWVPRKALARCEIGNLRTTSQPRIPWAPPTMRPLRRPYQSRRPVRVTNVDNVRFLLRDCRAYSGQRPVPEDPGSGKGSLGTAASPPRRL